MENCGVITLKDLERKAYDLRYRIKFCYRSDRFIQAEKYEYELELVKEEIELWEEN